MSNHMKKIKKAYKTVKRGLNILSEVAVMTAVPGARIKGGELSAYSDELSAARKSKQDLKKLRLRLQQKNKRGLLK